MIPFSLSQPIIPEREAHMSRLNLFKYKDAITGRVSRSTAINAITPQELLITPILDVTVLNASEIDGPTMGIKLPMANFAVFIERESTLWVSVFWNEKTKEKIIIENTVNVTKVLRMNFDIPPKPSSPDIAFTIQNTRHTFEMGISKAIIMFSISAINIIIVALPRPAVDIFPLIIFSTVITGAKAFIT